jgi:hydrogenase nickel incorporation protein HypA/HybF
MHELSIAESVVGIVRGHAAGRRVASVQLRVGELRQVVPTSLEFAFQLLGDGTELEGAELEMELVPAAGLCRDCGAETALSPFPLSCARCGGMNVEVTAGEELVVDSLELEELAEDRLTQTGGTRYGD